jgi:hypothetical protein
VLDVTGLAAPLAGRIGRVVLCPSFPTTVPASGPDIPIAGLANPAAVGDFPYIRHVLKLLFVFGTQSRLATIKNESNKDTYPLPRHPDNKNNKAGKTKGKEQRDRHGRTNKGEQARKNRKQEGRKGRHRRKGSRKEKESREGRRQGRKESKERRTRATRETRSTRS